LNYYFNSKNCFRNKNYLFHRKILFARFCYGLLSCHINYKFYYFTAIHVKRLAC